VGVRSRFARWAAALTLLAAGFMLAGCFYNPPLRPIGYVTPRDFPPLPQRKPAPPSDLAAWASPMVTASSGISGPGIAADAASGSEAVEVQELAPQTVSQSSVSPSPAGQPSVVQQAAAAQTAASRAEPAVAAQPAPDRNARPGRYTVSTGDSLYGIARRFGLPIRAVIDANNLQPPYALSIGQELAVPQAQVHEVVAGDTIYSIARRYDIDRSELVRINNLQAPYTIPLGHKLLLPTPGSAVHSAPPAPEAIEVNYTPPDDPAPQAPAAAPEPPTPQVTAPPQPAPKSRDAVRQALANPPARAGSSFLWPVQGPLLSSYGAKDGGEHNDGINIAAPRGSPVRAAENGVVAYAGEELKGFGKLLLVKHADGWVTAYAHNEELLVGAGDTVKRGQTIAKVGSSGHVERPQLHFEVRRGTRAVDPQAQLSPRTASAAN
jgi:murein DD-endopeptidase MepM/ murein hydrolase activator NlpD